MSKPASIFVESYYGEADDVYSVNFHNNDHCTPGVEIPGWALPYFGIIGEPSEIVGKLFVLFRPVQTII